MPYGAHPSGQLGFYDFDYAFQGASGMNRIGRSRDEWTAWAAEWIYGLADNAAYMEHYRESYGADALGGIVATRGPSPQEGVRYSYAERLRFRM